MVNHCANPQCCKPLHYLREGRVYIFDVTRPANNGERTPRRMEHFWLCGGCSETFSLEQAEDHSVRISPRTQRVASATVLPYKPASLATHSGAA